MKAHFETLVVASDGTDRARVVNDILWGAPVILTADPTGTVTAAAAESSRRACTDVVMRSTRLCPTFYWQAAHHWARSSTRLAAG